MENKKIRISEAEYDAVCEYRKSLGKSFVPKEHFKRGKGKSYRTRLCDEEQKIVDKIRKGCTIESQLPLTKKEREEYEELKQIMDVRDKSAKVEIYKIENKESDSERSSIPVFLLSDVHYEEIIRKESVLGKNEYNPEIAKQRLDTYFRNVVKLTTHAQRSYHGMNSIVIGVLGDLINNYIHEELQQTNAMTPLDAISDMKTILLSGLKYVHDNANVDKITVVWVCGNHGRSSHKSQFSNFTQMSHEYYLGVDIKTMCEVLGLNKFEFVIPRSEMAILEMFGKRYLFTHGTRIKGGGGVGGIAVPISRYFNRIARALDVVYMFIAHFHQSVKNKQFLVNGSVVGYSPYAMGNGCDYEPPQQSMLILDSKRGITAYNEVYLD